MLLLHMCLVLKACYRQLFIGMQVHFYCSSTFSPSVSRVKPCFCCSYIQMLHTHVLPYTIPTKVGRQVAAKNCIMMQAFRIFWVGRYFLQQSWPTWHRVQILCFECLLTEDTFIFSTLRMQKTYLYRSQLPSCLLILICSICIRTTHGILGIRLCTAYY